MTKPIRPFGHPTPWQRIVEACGKGVGIRLSWEELVRLCQDHAIVTRATLDNEEESNNINGGEVNGS